MAPINITSVGQTISRLRKENNMTQMELADLMGISFQAVSNWERGNSMPDITKLPELAELFGVSIDELLGQYEPLVQLAVEDKLAEYVAEHNVTSEEVADVAPILKPAQVDEVVAAGNFEDLSAIESLLPFLGHELIAELAAKAFDAGRSVDGMLPFLRQADVQALAQKALTAGRSIDDYLPFLPTAEVDRMAREYAAQGRYGRAEEMCPFLSKATVTELAVQAMKEGRDASGFFPFLPSSSRQEMAQLIYNQRRQLSDLAEIAPFLDRKWLTALALDSVESGRHALSDLDDIAPFLDKQTLAELIRKMYLKDQ